MAKVLFIKSNPKDVEDSNTFQLAREFLNEYKKLNPDDEIDFIDLYEEENLKFIDSEMLQQMFSGQDNIMAQYAKHFTEYDKYVFATPLWNLSFPAILKAYFDYICYAGITFKYTEQGSVGLLKDRPRKAIYITSRGGEYTNGPLKDLGELYAHTILNFLGVSDVETLALENTNVFMGEALEKAKEDAFNRAREVAHRF